MFTPNPPPFMWHSCRPHYGIDSSTRVLTVTGIRHPVLGAMTRVGRNGGLAFRLCPPHLNFRISTGAENRQRRLNSRVYINAFNRQTEPTLLPLETSILL